MSKGKRENRKHPCFLKNKPVLVVHQKPSKVKVAMSKNPSDKREAKHVVKMFVPPADCKPTAEMLEYYEKYGYLLFKGFMDTGELDIYNQRFTDLIEGRAPVAPQMTVMKDVMVAKGVVSSQNKGMTINKIQSFIYDDVLVQYSKNKKIVTMSENIMSPKGGVRIIHSMLINKPPGLVDDSGKVVGGRHPIHQDLFYFDQRPPEMIVATWTAMQPVNRENGCLMVIPGSHKSLYRRESQLGAGDDQCGLLDHELPKWKYINTAYFGVRDLPKNWREKRVYVNMDAGDTILFHPLLLHGSGRNRSNGYRRAISTHYASERCHTVPYGDSSMAMWDEMVPTILRRLQRDGTATVATTFVVTPIVYACLYRAGVQSTIARVGGSAAFGLLMGLLSGCVRVRQNAFTKCLTRITLWAGMHRGHHMSIKSPSD
eukprot:CFRG4338T1